MGGAAGVKNTLSAVDAFVMKSEIIMERVKDLKVPGKRSKVKGEGVNPGS